MKLKCYCFFIIMFIIILSPKIYADTNTEFSLNVNDVTLENIAAHPVILNGYVMIPMRDVFEQIGADVNWVDQTRSIHVTYDSNELIIQPDTDTASFNKENVLMQIKPEIIDGHTMIPLQFFADILGFNASWDENTGRIDINTHMNDSDEINNSNDESVTSATINNIYIPNTQEEHIFKIEASSEISNYEYSVTENGIMTIDIYNSVMDVVTQYVVEDSPNVSLIRVQQLEIDGVKVTRVLMELRLTSSIYNVFASEDNKSINIKFEENKINDINVEHPGNTDYVTITADRLADLSISNVYGSNNIVIDILNGTYKDVILPNVKGNFIIDGDIKQIDYNTVRISLALKQPVSYSVSEKDNTVTVVINEPTFKNITYDNENRVLIIKKNPDLPIDINSVIHNDNDYHIGYILTFAADHSQFLGYGDIEIKNEVIDSFEILTEDEKTSIIVQQNKIIALDVTEDKENIYIHIISPKDKYDKIVILDPGHGDHDTGADYFDVMEKDLNLIVSNMTKEILEREYGIKVYATRVTDVFVPLIKRAQMANEGGDLFISIHHNSFTNETVKGTETYYLEHETDNSFNITRQQAAEIFQTNIVNELGTKDRGIKTADFAVLRETTIPSVLLELGFISNPEENLMFSDPIIQQKIAKIICESVMKVFELYTPPRN